MLHRTLLLFPCALLILAATGAQSEQVPQALLDDIPPLAQLWGEDPVIVDAVKAHNAQALSLSDIQSLDRRWQDSAGLEDFMTPYFENPAAERLRELESRAGFVLESFIMGDQGGIVAATNKTSDYWQGDESKFTESFDGGRGAIHVGDVEFDSSAQAYLVQVSIPVFDADAAIGAITIGMDISAYDP